MSDSFNIAVIVDIEQPNYDRSKIVKAIAPVLKSKGVWTAIPGLFAFKSKVNVVEVQQAISENIDHFIVLNFDPAQIDGQLEDEEWDLWSRDVFRENIGAMLAFHGGTDLTEEDWLQRKEGHKK